MIRGWCGFHQPPAFSPSFWIEAGSASEGWSLGGTVIPDSENLDDKTLLILMVIAELMGQKSDPKHILTMYERKLDQLKTYQRTGR